MQQVIGRFTAAVAQSHSHVLAETYVWLKQAVLIFYCLNAAECRCWEYCVLITLSAIVFFGCFTVNICLAFTWSFDNCTEDTVSCVISSLGLPRIHFLCGVTEVIKRERWVFKASGGQLTSRQQLPLKLAWAISIHKSQVSVKSPSNAQSTVSPDCQRVDSQHLEFPALEFP